MNAVCRTWKPNGLLPSEPGAAPAGQSVRRQCRHQLVDKLPARIPRAIHRQRDRAGLRMTSCHRDQDGRPVRTILTRDHPLNRQSRIDSRRRSTRHRVEFVSNHGRSVADRRNRPMTCVIEMLVRQWPRGCLQGRASSRRPTLWRAPRYERGRNSPPSIPHPRPMRSA